MGLEFELADAIFDLLKAFDVLAYFDVVGIDRVDYVTVVLVVGHHLQDVRAVRYHGLGLFPVELN